LKSFSRSILVKLKPAFYFKTYPLSAFVMVLQLNQNHGGACELLIFSTDSCSRKKKGFFGSRRWSATFSEGLEVFFNRTLCNNNRAASKLALVDLYD